MNRLEEYLKSIERTLDVRDQAERESIVAEIRDHVLEATAKLESEGVQHDLAVERAIEQVGDSRLVASRVSEAHDGGSWRQAGLAVIPIGIAFLSYVLSVRGFRTAIAWPITVIELLVLLGAYRYLSSREQGRMWKVPWLAVIFSSALQLLLVLCYWLFLPSAVRQAVLGWLGGTSRVSAHALSTQSYVVLLQWQWGIRAVVMSAAVAVLLFSERRGLRGTMNLAVFAALTVVFFIMLKMRGDSAPWPIIAYVTVYIVLVSWLLAYLFFVKRWRGDWAMAYAFILTMGSAAMPILPPQYSTMLLVVAGGARALVLAATLAAYIMLPRKLALPVFLTYILLLPADRCWGHPLDLVAKIYVVMVVPAVLSLLLFRLFVYLAQNKLSFSFKLKFVDRGKAGLA